MTAKTVDIKTNRMTAKAGHINKTCALIRQVCAFKSIALF